MMPGLKEVPYEIRLKRLKLWTLEDQRVRADLIEVFKLFCGLSVVDIDKFFELDKSSRTRGHILKLKKSRVVTDLRKIFFTERVIDIWNHLESSVVKAETMNMFKSRLRKIHHTDEYSRPYPEVKVKSMRRYTSH